MRFVDTNVLLYAVSDEQDYDGLRVINPFASSPSRGR